MGGLLARKSMFATSQQQQNINTNVNTNTNVNDIEDKGQEEEEEKEKEQKRKSLQKTQVVTQYTSILFQTLSLIYFLVMTILSSTVPSLQNKIVYDEIVLGATTIALFFGLISTIRDYKTNRFTFIQRLMYIVSTCVLCLGCIILVAKPTSNINSSSYDYISMTLLILYFILSLFESYHLIYPNASSSDNTTTSKKHLGKAIFIILKPYFWPSATASSAFINRTRALLTWFCVISSKACTLIGPIYLGKASTALALGQYPTCARYAVIYTVFQFSSTFLKECQSLVYLKVAQAAFIQLSEVVFYHLHNLSLDWHLKKKLGEVIRSMDRGILACDTLMKYLFLWLLPAIAECILVCVIFSVYFDYLPLAVTIFIFVFTYIIWTICVTLWRKKFRKNVAESDNEWHDRCTDSLINFETVKYFTAEQYEMERFAASIEKYQSSSVQVQASLSFLNISQTFLMQSCLATALVLATYGIRKRTNCCIANGCIDGLSECCSNLSDVCGGMEVGDFIAVLTYTLNLFYPLNFLGSVYNMVVMAMVDLRNLSELLAESPDVTDAADAIQMPSENSIDPDIAVEFDNVVFHYPSQSDSNGLKGISFKMKRGTTTAIVGSTGAGKTTVSRLLFRFYDVLSGAVKVNGVDVRTVTQKSLREQIGVVPQATSLFNDTIKSNIKYGNREATDDQIRKVIESSQLHTFIETLPDGWDTLVGDRGLKLSGGEKQRAAIARCLLKDPSIVVLDEATSALDTVTENSVQEALNALGSHRTCLVIAHRLGTIRNADNIIVLGDGGILEEGTHDELLAKNGKYADMWNMQLHSTRSSYGSLTALDMSHSSG
jgi:ABC-type transport system involved in Fe-S cluster assembly fused permease/ATPase subunit